MYISFDFWNTLVDSNPKFREEKIKLFQKYNSDLTAEKINDSFKKTKKELNTIIEPTGWMPTREIIWDLLFDNLGFKEFKSNRIWSVCKESLIFDYKELFLKYPPTLKEGVKETIQILEKEGHHLFISSNTLFIPAQTIKILISQLGLNFKEYRMLFSCEKGSCKPTLQMFSHFPDLHIGDNEETDGACKNYGIEFFNVKEKDFRTIPNYLCSINNKNNE